MTRTRRHSVRRGLAAIAAGLALASGRAAEYGLIGHWPFDNSLADAAGQAGAAAGAGFRFVEGRTAMALQTDGTPVTVPDRAELQLLPGLALDVWVQFDTAPSGYETLVIKEKEYQLRVDALSEGGRYSFFVFLGGGWEPRVHGPVPTPGRWQHVRAGWTGQASWIEVDGDRQGTHRGGVPVPTDNPLVIGRCNGRLDDLRLLNPARQRSLDLRALLERDSAAAPLRTPHAGGADGWAGWTGLGGARVGAGPDGLAVACPGPEAMAVSPRLDVPLDGTAYVCLDVEAPGVTSATLVYVTDRGEGTVLFPVWRGGRTSLVQLSAMPAWAGRLRLLAVGFGQERACEARLRELWVSREPEGQPYLVVRSLAPGRAKLRVGRDETVVTTLRNLGKSAPEVQVALAVPAGVEVLDGPTPAVGGLDYDGTRTVSWRIRAATPVRGPATARATVPGTTLAAEATCALDITPLPDLPKADYVPVPQPVKTPLLTLMHYCPLWKEGTHYGWERIEPWPERRPAIGWYDEGTPEVADWHIKYALEHGVQGFIYCWYRATFDPEIKLSLGHALHDGMLKARYLDRFTFVIMWENGCAKGVQSREDLLDNVLPFWLRNYFHHPSYVVIDGKPLLVVWRPERVAPELGGSENTRQVFDEMRAACRREGFAGLWIVGCVGTADRALLERLAREGWDATTAYGLIGQTPEPPGRDVEGVMTLNHGSSLLGQKDIWLGKKAVGALPDIVDVMMGWDPRPWHGKSTHSYLAGAAPAHFLAACRQAKAVIDATPGNGLDKRLVVFDNWNEFGEGHYLEPCSGFGFEFADAIRAVFAEAAGPCLDIVPEDVGLEPPERVYRQRRAALARLADRPRRVEGNLLAWWRFDDDDPAIAEDSSACGFHGLKQEFATAPGRSGQGFLCRGGSVSVPAHRLFWPVTGLSVEVWLKPGEPDQSDRWLLNTVGRADTGYRLGLGGGKLAWQVPQTAWSHHLTSPAALPVGEWTHAVATCDSTGMRLFVNGAQVATLERSGPIVPSDAALCIGSFAPGHPAAHFRGVLDDLRLYDRALTPDEVLARYQAPAAP